jgi:outer membrane protein assembly factor BamE
MRYFSKIFTPICLIVSCFFVGCGSKLPALKSYKMDIQQGNVVTSKMLLQLRPGMTKSQVRYIMGTPLIVDSFHGNRWDYFYQLRQQGKVIEKRRVILDFDKELLTTVRGDVVAASDKTADTPVDTSARSVTTTKKPVEKPWFDMFKFWGSDEPAAAPEAAPATSSATTDLPAETAAVAAAAVASSAASPAPVGAEAATAAAAADIANEGAVETESILKKKPEMAGVDSVNLLPQAPEAQASVAAEATPEQIAAEVLPQRAGGTVAATAVAAATGGEVGDAAQAIQATVSAWVDAWRNKNVKAYFAAYADGFKPENGLSKSAWAAQRKQRLSGKRGDISLVLEDVAVTQHGNQASVQFFQKYASKVFSDEVTKQLDLQFDAAAQRWLIVREFVVANGKRASEQKILAPEESSEHLDGVIEKIGF